MKHTVTITLEISTKAKRDDVQSALDSLLDDGQLQDTIIEILGDSLDHPSEIKNAEGSVA